MNLDIYFDNLNFYRYKERASMSVSEYLLTYNYWLPMVQIMETLSQLLFMWLYALVKIAVKDPHEDLLIRNGTEPTYEELFV